MKKIALVFLLSGAITLAARAQGKDYYIGHHAVSLQYAAHIFGIQPTYQYIFNPKARFMWVGRAGERHVR